MWVIISSVATFLMAIATFCTLYQNGKQLKELKRQWKEQNRSRIMPLFLPHNGKGYLRIKNISNIAAYGISVEIISRDNSVIDDEYIFYQQLKEKLSNSILSLDPLGIKDFLMIYTLWPETNYNGFLEVNINYNNEYCESFGLDLSEFNILEDSITNENAIAEKISRLTSVIETKRL